MSDLNLIAVVERSGHKAAGRALNADQRIGIAVVRCQQLEPADDARRIILDIARKANIKPE